MMPRLDYRLAGVRTIEDLCAHLVTEFDVTPDICRTEVEAFLEELAKHGAIALDPSAAA